MASGKGRRDKGAKKAAAQKKARSSTPAKKRRDVSPKLKGIEKRGRVDKRRSLKSAKASRTDEEVALVLMDEMNTMPTESSSSKPSDEKFKFSQTELQAMIEQEVRTIVQQKENKLKDLIETIQQLDRTVEYERSIQDLEVRINTVSKRAAAAITYMETQKNSSLHRDNVNNNRTDPDDNTMEVESQAKSEDMDGELFRVTETTKEALKKMQEDNEALKAVLADLIEELPLPVLTPQGPPACQFSVFGLLTNDNKETKKNVEESTQREELQNGAKVECPPLSTKSTDSDQGPKLFHPPLPPMSFPSTLNMEAASYSVPPTLHVRLALIRNPVGLSVLWSVNEEDPSAPPMDSYCVLMTVEKVKGSNVFPDWTVKKVEAKPLPMCMMFNKYKPGRRVCVAVMGKDKFGRYGSYSKVVTASIPE